MKFILVAPLVQVVVALSRDAKQRFQLLTQQKDTFAYKKQMLVKNKRIIIRRVFSDKRASDKILSYEFGGDFNSSLEEILARWKKWMPVVEITVSCHIESSRKTSPTRNLDMKSETRAGGRGGRAPTADKKNVLLQGGTKYRFDLSNGKSYHLHTTGLFTPGLWLKCELNHRTLQPPGDFALVALYLLPPPPLPPTFFTSSPPIQGLSAFSFPTTSQRKLENQKDNAWRGLLLLRGDREARYDEEK